MPSEEDTPFERYDFTRRSYEMDYARRTLALLYGTSANLCAFPGCPNKIIAEPTEFDQATITGQIAHIYSRSSIGPRPYPYRNPTKAKINHFDNLILLCRVHHALVDGQERTFTANHLKDWKSLHIKKHLSILRSSIPDEYRTFTLEKYLQHYYDRRSLEGSEEDYRTAHQPRREDLYNRGFASAIYQR